MARVKKVKKLKMVPDERLVKLVATRQTGDPMKGLRELIQNAWDTHDEYEKETGKRPPPINIKVGRTALKKPKTTRERIMALRDGSFKGSVLIFSDNGIGWGKSKKEFEEKMMRMGAKWKDQERGEFGIGRGQALGIIYDPDMDDYDGNISVTTMIDGEPWTIDGFHIKGDDIVFNEARRGGKKTLGSKTHGTEWKIISNNPDMFDRMDIEVYLEENIKGEHPIKLNRKVVSPPIKGKKHVLGELATMYIVPATEASEFEVYNRGIRIETAEIVNGWGGDILIKGKVVTDMSRGAIHDEDDNWKLIQSMAEEIIFKDIDSKVAFNAAQRRGIRNQIYKDNNYAHRWMRKRIWKLSDGKLLNLTDLLIRAKNHDMTLFYGPDTLANSSANDLGFGILAAVLGESYRFDKLMEFFNVEVVNAETAKALEPIRTEGYEEISEEDLTKQEVMLIDLMEKILEASTEEERNVRMGEGPATAWTDGRETIWFNRDSFEKTIKDIGKGGAHQIRVVIDMLPHLIHEMTHSQDTRGTLRHDTEDFHARHNIVTKNMLIGARSLFKDNKMFNAKIGEWTLLKHEMSSKAKKKLKDEVGI